MKEVIVACDGYKLSHHFQYPEGTEMVYSNWTPRSCKYFPEASEGSVCPIRVPMMTIKNTLPEFFWLTNYLETLISCTLWLPCTSATSARLYKKELKRHAERTRFPDDGTKNSLKGLIKVVKDANVYKALDQQTEEEEKQGCLETVFIDGTLVKDYTLQEIRDRINSTL